MNSHCWWVKVDGHVSKCLHLISESCRKTERDGLRRCEWWQQASVPTAGPCPASMKCTAGVIISGGVSSTPYYHLTPPLTIHLPSSSHTSSDVNYVSTHICHTNSYCYADMHSRTDTQVAPTSIIIERLKQDQYMIIPACDLLVLQT